MVSNAVKMDQEEVVAALKRLRDDYADGGRTFLSADYSRIRKPALRRLL
jgi:hypothetical protein